jgi:hypothetical protein
MQREIQHIRAGKRLGRGSGEKQFRHDPIAQDANGWFGGGGGGMGSHQQTEGGPVRIQGALGTIKEIAHGSTLWMNRLSVWGLFETSSHSRQIKQAVVFTADKDAEPRCEQGRERGERPIQAVQTNEDVARGRQSQPA